MNFCQCPAIQVKREKTIKIKDDVCLEDTFRLYLNGEPLIELIASPEQLKELGVGFVVCEGLAQSVDNVNVSGNKIMVFAKTSGKFERELRFGGGLGTRRALRKVISPLVIKNEDVFRVISEVESEAWNRTGGVHCSTLFSNKNLVVKSSDVGRHNTIDKVVGFAILNGIALSTGIIGCTGRQPAGIISKVANAGIPIIISKAASTNKGISTADEAGITLVCFARDRRFTVYTHPYRICEIAEAI
jgi:FdhD protein